MVPGVEGSNPFTHPIVLRQESEQRLRLFTVSPAQTLDNGMSPSGKARDFDSRIRRFDPCHPSQFNNLIR